MSAPGIFRPPPPTNEPIKDFAPGSPEREQLRRRLDQMQAERIELPLVIGGENVTTGTTTEVVMSHKKGHVLADAHQGGQAEVDKAMTTPTEITFWSWVPRIEKEVALFQAKYPAIKIKVVNAGAGQPEYTKLRTALKAGTGAPDVAQIEFQFIPTFSLTKSLVDLRPYGADAVKAKFVDWTWGQVTGRGGEVWGYPQDTGPMGMLYRKDIFDKYNIDLPTTWDEFAAAAKKLHTAAPDIKFTNLAPNNNGVWMGLVWQAGGRPFKNTAADAVSVSVNDEISKKVGTYWDGLLKDGSVSTDPDFTDAWFQGLARGKYAAWITAAWGPLFLTGSAKGSSGKWRAAPLPQWDASKPASGNWGGSTSAVIMLMTIAAIMVPFIWSELREKT
jgi:multiple sugar transport system substrate-binding protein